MKVTHDNINTFLYTPGKYFVIPDFQRPYSWDKTNIVSFLEDLESVMTGNKHHYFGSIVYINEGNNSTIIDGQQRATTVLLMLTALYHIATDRPEASTMSAEEIKEKYLYNRHDYSENVNRIKLRTVTTDNEIFKQIFNGDDFAKDSKDSRLYQAYAYFYEYFKAKNELQRYVDTLEHFEVVTIALDSSDDNPQRIFESINSTGKPLTDGDKIRNFALMLNDAKARKTVLTQYWGKIENQLTDINKDYISDFFRYYLTSHLQKEVKLERVYPEFKNVFRSAVGDSQDNLKKLEAFYSKIVDHLQHYAFLKFNIDTDHHYAVVADKGFRLNYLKIEVTYPFLMRALDEYKRGNLDGEELLRVFTIIESYLARRIICNIPTTGLNGLFASLHKDITNYASEYPKYSYSDILAYILMSKSGGVRMPKEAEIEASIRTNPMYSQRNSYINFILSSVDDQSKESTLLKQIDNGDIQLTIEHIMPQTLNRAWHAALGSDYELVHQQYLHTLPNLTLTGYNSTYSNNDFTTKKTVSHGFNDSPLLINQYLKKVGKWDSAALKRREKWWLKQIEKIWPLPKTEFKPDAQETEFTFGNDKDLSHSAVKGVIIMGETTECKTWIAVFDTILKKLFALDENLYDYVIADDNLHKYIKADKQELRRPNVLKDTPFYYESNIDNNLKRDIIAELAEHLELDKTDIKVILASKDHHSR